jgi:hypothetical protein
MREHRVECPHCKRRMEQGYMLEKGDSNAPAVTHWVQGAPEKSFWMGLKLQGRPVIPVMTYRCEKCGYLESYARPVPET